MPFILTNNIETKTHQKNGNNGNCPTRRQFPQFCFLPVRPSWPCTALCHAATRPCVWSLGVAKWFNLGGVVGEEEGVEGLLPCRTHRLRLPSMCGEVFDTSKSRFPLQLQHVAYQRPGSRHRAVSRLICRRTTAACVHRQRLLAGMKHLLRSCPVRPSVPEPRRRAQCLDIAD